MRSERRSAPVICANPRWQRGQQNTRVKRAEAYADLLVTLGRVEEVASVAHAGEQRGGGWCTRKPIQTTTTRRERDADIDKQRGKTKGKRIGVSQRAKSADGSRATPTGLVRGELVFVERLALHFALDVRLLARRHR